MQKATLVCGEVVWEQMPEAEALGDKIFASPILPDGFERLPPPQPRRRLVARDRSSLVISMRRLSSFEVRSFNEATSPYTYIYSLNLSRHESRDILD